MMNKTPLLCLSLALLALPACHGGKDDGQAAPAAMGSLEGTRVGGPFTLTDQDGKSRSWDSFRGQYRLVYFGYTYCPDVCPIDLQRLAQGYRLFEKQAPQRAAKVQPIFITLDPERDTPEVVKTYVGAFHPKMIGLTGTPEQIKAVAKQFAVVYMREPSDGSSAYLISHSRTPYLFGPNGEPVALMPVDDPVTEKEEGTPQEIAAALNRWVK